MLGTVHALARWLLAALGALALVTSVALGTGSTLADSGDEESIAAASGTPGAIDLAQDAEEPSEERDEDERDEKVALHRDALVLAEVLPEPAALDSHGRRRVVDDDRVGHARSLDRPPHA